jgi:hypothetical protein
MPVFREFLLTLIKFSLLSSVRAMDHEASQNGDGYAIAVIPLVLFIIVLVALASCAQYWPTSCYGGYENCPTRDRNIVNVRIVADETNHSGGSTTNISKEHGAGQLLGKSEVISSSGGQHPNPQHKFIKYQHITERK